MSTAQPPVPTFHLDLAAGPAVIRSYSPAAWAALPAGRRPRAYLDPASGHYLAVERPADDVKTAAPRGSANPPLSGLPAPSVARLASG